MKKVVVITGVSGGIGAVTARVFSEAGWYVIGTDLDNNENLPGVDRFVRADMADETASVNFFYEISDKEGRVDALINNAGIQITKSLVQTTIEEWDKVMSFNLRSVYLSIRNAYPIMKENGGSIVNVSSVHAVATSENIAAYAASKGALMALTRATAIELARDRIRVNAVLPGAIDTKMLRDGLGRGHLEGADTEDLLMELGSKHVIGRIGRPVEVAQAILFLADGATSSFITGQALVVDGGALSKLSTE